MFPFVSMFSSVLPQNDRTNHERCSIRKVVPKSYEKFPRKHLFWILFLIKLHSLRPASSLKKRLQPRCFSMNFAIFLRMPFLQNTSGRLLVSILMQNETETILSIIEAVDKARDTISA